MDFVDSNIYLADKAVKNESVNNISLKELFKAVQFFLSPTHSLSGVISAFNFNASTIETTLLSIISKAVQDEEHPIELVDFEFPKEDELSEILFTTGTTGKSKGIEVTYGCDIFIAQNVMDSVEMGKDFLKDTQRRLLTVHQIHLTETLPSGLL